MPVLYVTAENVRIHVVQGGKSPNDFIVKYQEPGKRLRTPKHIHLVVDLFAKRTANRELTNQLIDHIIVNILDKIHPSTSFPPVLQILQPGHIEEFSALSQFGEYSIEFLLVLIELIMIQEKTNYPNGKLNRSIFNQLRNGRDIFSIVSAATFR